MIRILSVLTLSELQRGEAGSPPPRDGDGGATDALGGGDPVATLVRHAAAFFLSPRDGDECAPGAPVPIPTVSTGRTTASCESPLSPFEGDGGPPPRDGDGGASDDWDGGDPVATPVRHAAAFFLSPRDGDECAPGAPVPTPTDSTVSTGCALVLSLFHFLDSTFPVCLSPLISS